MPTPASNPDSHASNPDSHVSNPDSHVSNPDSHASNPDSHASNRHASNPDSHASNPDSHDRLHKRPINNRSVKKLASLNPLNQEVLGEVPISSAQELAKMVSEARQAQRQWAQLSLAQRAEQLTQAYQSLSPRQAQLARLISLEMGKDQRRAGYEAMGTVDSAPFMIAEVAEALRPERLAGSSQLQYRPLGVVGLISPWNYPLAMANNLLIPALMAGNAVILKPSELTPLVAEQFVRGLQPHLPAGLVQLAQGDAAVGQALVQADIQMIAFTGSVATGRDIMANAASGLKRLVMELGGNDPMLVMANADLQAAARFAVASACENAGQMCTSTERIYVDQQIAEPFKQAVVHIARQYQTGPWDQPGVHIGPLASPAQHAKVLAQLNDAEQQGAQFLLGQADYPLPFVKPTVISGLTPEMRLEQEETFGPVIAIAEVSSMQEAIARANDSIYGLGAIVFGGSGAKEVAEQLEAGMVSVNQGVGGPGDSPWVGAKQSGFGFHGSAAGHRQFSQPRVINY